MKSLSLTQPHVILMVGLPGSGKTFFAEKFATTFSAPYVSIEKILPYASDVNSAYEIFNGLYTELLKTNQSIIVEGATDTKGDRETLAKQAKVAGYQTLVVWVQTEPSTAKNRSIKTIKNKSNRTISPEQYNQTVRRFAMPSQPEKFIVISGKHTYATQAKIVLRKLSSPRTEILSQESIPPRIQQNRRNNIIVR